MRTRDHLAWQTGWEIDADETDHARLAVQHNRDDFAVRNFSFRSEDFLNRAKGISRGRFLKKFERFRQLRLAVSGEKMDGKGHWGAQPPNCENV
jgi:hypothetical protein